MSLTCTPEKLYVGDTPSIEMTYRDIHGDLMDPGSIEVRFSKQGGTVTTINHPDASIVQVSTGVWLFTFPAPISTAGTYWVTVTAAGGGNSKTEQIKLTVHGTHS